MSSANYRRILLKVSGEMLAGEQGYGIQPSILEGLASEIASVVALDIEVAVVIGGVSLSVLLLAAVAVIYKGFNSQVSNTMPATTQAVATTSPAAQKISKETASSNVDSFAQAVRVAEQAATDGQTAQSREDWLVVAAKWQQASDLMAAVPSKHPRYTTAVNRAALYRQNSDKAQQEAQNK